MDMRIANLKEPGFFNGTIHCRVTCKRPVRTFPDGYMVSVDLADESGEIRAVAFNNQATRMDQLLHLDQVYRIKTFKLQTKRDQYSQSPHDLEFYFREETLVIPMPDDDSLPHKKYRFVPLRSVLRRKLKSFVDVIGVVVDAGELEQCTYEDGKTSDMRDVTLADQSGFTIEARLWGRPARDFDGSDHPVLAFGNIMIPSPDPNKPGLSRFLDAKVQTSILKNPDFPETTTLREWFSANKDDLLCTEDSEMDDSNTSTSSNDFLTEDSGMDDSNTSTSSSDVEGIQRIVKDALKNRSVKVKVVKSVFLGPQGVGKTQLKRALLGDFRKVEQSTNISTRAVPAVEVLVADTTHKKWELLKCIHLNKLSADKISWSDKQWSSPPRSSIETCDQRPVTRRSASVDSQVTSISQSPMGQLKPSVAIEEDTFESRSKRFAKIDGEILKSITEASSDNKGPLEFKLVYIIDNGGQPSFLDFHSVTATFAASYVHLFDASKGLAAFPEMTFRKTKFPIRDMPPSIYSNVDLLRRSLLTVHHFKHRFNQRHEKIRALLGESFQPADSPHVLIIGTHKGSSEISVREAADHKRVHSICESIPSLKHQYDIIFVDSLNQKCKELRDIRETLSAQEDNLSQFDLPLSWFQVYLLSFAKGSEESLQAQKYDDLYKMCLQQNHVKSPEEFKAMITVMHCLGVFSIPELEQLDPKDDFSDVLIFFNPNLLFEYLTQIFAIPFRKLSSSSSHLLRKLQDRGELTPECLSKLDIPDTLGTLPGFHNKLLGWLVNWHLAAKKDGENQWFIPSVLPPRPKETPQFIPRGYFENVFPLYLTFFQAEDTTSNNHFHYLPAGFFPHLVVHLMQTGRFYLPENSRNNEIEYPYRCRDSIFLSERDGPGLKFTLNIRLVDESDRLAVHMWPDHEALVSDPSALHRAGAVLADLTSCMTQTNERLFCTSIGNIALCSACRCKPAASPQCTSQPVQPALIHLAKVGFSDREFWLQCLKRSGSGVSKRDVDDDSLIEVLRGFSGQARAQDSPRTRKRGVVERIHSEPSHSKTRVPQPKRSATDPSQAQRLSKRESAKALRTLPLEKDLREISDNCGDSWKRLLTYVGLKSTKIQEFKNDENTLPDACFQGLVHWLGGNVNDSDPVNWSTLLTAMKKAEMAGNGREWKQKIVERCTASLDKPRDAGQSGTE